MNIKEIVDKIPKETDVRADQYTVADRIVDINTKMLLLWEKARQIGGKYPVYSGNTEDESFVVVAGDQTLTRTIKDVSIKKVEWRVDSSSRWEKVERDIYLYETYYYEGIKFTANEKEIYVTNAVAGNVRITYEGSKPTEFVVADYSLGTPPTPSWLPVVFHSLLWLGPAMTQTYYYNKEKYKILEAQHIEIYDLFKTHYERDVETEYEIERGRDNYR